MVFKRGIIVTNDNVDRLCKKCKQFNREILKVPDKEDYFVGACYICWIKLSGFTYLNI